MESKDQTDLLRASRDGDQFHYHWAARQALQLLRPGTDLFALVVEGVSQGDTASTGGDEVVDLSEYWGSDDLATATRIVYRQLKHSTADPGRERKSSFLKKTLIGFAKKYRSVLDEVPRAADRVFFEFVSVPPLAAAVHVALEDLATGREPHAPKEAAYIAEHLSDLTAAEIPGFVSKFVIRDGEPGLFRLRQTFRSEIASYLPGAAAAQDILLREMIATRASSIAGFDPRITRNTVLSTLQMTEEMLLPAPNLITVPSRIIELDQVRELEQVVVAASGPVIGHATGGMGKSVLASTVGHKLPPGSVTVVYDCFGDGGYRRLSSRRHEHRQALLQMCNELAAMGLCDPVLPSDTASAGDYMRIFLDRLATAADMVKTASPDAALLLIVDAADNAVMAGDDFGVPSFVPDLLREHLPPGVRLLVLCRTERVSKLNPTSDCLEVPLRGFKAEHSRQHLADRFGEASEADGQEFHHLTDGNPRVQTLVMDDAQSVAQALHSLGDMQNTGSNLFDELMDRKVAKLREELGGEVEQIDRLCRALAALRPRIPVNVVAEIAGVDSGFVRSFATDLGPSILVDQATVQFRDEPTETWFRKRFRPTGAALSKLIDVVTPLADVYPYLSAALPQLLYEADMVPELVDLALSDAGLAEVSDLERREIAHQRAQFALKAALRDGRELDAARLAWASGELHAGEARRHVLIRNNTDLAGEFLDEQTIDSMLATKALAGTWPGSHLHVEAAVLAATGTDTHLARSRLRSAQEWMTQWTRQAVALGESHEVKDSDIAHLAWGLLTVDGPEACVDFLALWSPRWVAYQVGRIVAQRLVDHDQAETLEDLAIAAKRLPRLQLAVISVSTQVGITLSEKAVRATIRWLAGRKTPVELGHSQRNSRPNPIPIAWALTPGLRHGLLEAGQAHQILLKYLPATLGHDAGGQFDRGGGTESLLFAYALNALLAEAPVDLHAIAPAGVRRDRADKPHQRMQSVVDYDANVVPLSPWTTLLAEFLIHGSTHSDILLEQFDSMASNDFKAYGDYETPRLLVNGISRIAVRVLAGLPDIGARSVVFTQWLSQNFGHLNWSTVVDLVRVCARSSRFHPLALELAQRHRAAIEADHLPAEERCDQLLLLARALYVFDAHEARADFNRAVEITSRLGEDVHDRWRALIAVADNSVDGSDQAFQAYRLAQVAEGLQTYLGDSGLAASALPQIERFSTTTAIAVASRWRDRRVGSLDQLVRALFDAEGGRLNTHPRWALAMLPMGAGGWRRNLEACGAVGDPTRDTLEQIITSWLGQQVGKGNLDTGVEIAEPYLPAADEHSARLLENSIDLTTTAGWEKALLAEPNDHQAWRRTEAALVVAAQAPVALLRPIIEAASDASSLSFYNYGQFIGLLGARNDPFPEAARAAVDRLVTRLIERFPREVTFHSHLVLDLRTIRSICGREPAAIVGRALRQLGARSELLTSSECYELVQVLAMRVEPVGNLRLLETATNSFIQVAPLDSADGPIDQLTLPPSDEAFCVAAFVWSAAGDTSKETRWRAAHTIRLWLALGCQDLVLALAELASEVDHVSRFVDARFVFYDKHALMWTLMAIDRACNDAEVPTSIAPLVPLLRRVAFDDPPNAVLTGTARRVLAHLHATGIATMSPGEVAETTMLSRPQVIHAEKYVDRPASTTALLDEPDPTPTSEQPTTRPHGHRWSRPNTRFSFFMDFEEHWCDWLGDAFGIAERRIVELVDEVIVDRWQSPFRGDMEDDARHGLKLFGDGTTYTHKSSWPTEDDLDFYLSLHALFEVAGYLARQYPVYMDPGADQDDFADWLRRFVPTRSDGRWLSDRRDRRPADLAASTPLLANQSPASGRRGWLFQVLADRFELLLSDEAWVTLNGYWTAGEWDRYELVRIDSVLVDPATVSALYLALQTAPNLHATHFPRPHTDDDEERRPIQYRLADLVEGRSAREGIDTQDPNAYGIDWPPPTPVPAVIDALGVTPDPDLREWSDSEGVQIETSMWDEGSDNQRGWSGHRLRIHKTALRKLLTTQRKAMLVSVEIDRHLNQQYGYEDEDDVTEELQPYIRYFVIREDDPELT